MITQTMLLYLYGCHTWFLALTDEVKFKDFENKVLSKIYTDQYKTVHLAKIEKGCTAFRVVLSRHGEKSLNLAGTDQGVL